MWTLAASLSYQVQYLRESLYRSALRLLESLEASDDVVPCIEQVQAWIHIVVYECTRVSQSRGWMSAGHAFRLVQLMRLHEIDSHHQVTFATGSVDGPIQEEKRRLFWNAYCLDFYVSFQADLPLTLHDKTVGSHSPEPVVHDGGLADPNCCAGRPSSHVRE